MNMFKSKKLKSIFIRYFSYLSIIQIITYAVSDANEKLSAT